MAKELKFKNIELFAGAGGLAIGLENAGFNPVALVEFDENAANTLRKNRPKWNVVQEDVSTLSSRNLLEEFGLQEEELDLLSGGAPCQPFSYAGKKLGLEDARGTLFYHYAVFLRKLRPKMFFFENVKGLLSHDHGRTYETMRCIFEDSGYSVQEKVLNAWEHGNAQKRERLVAIGIRSDLENKLTFDFPAPRAYKPVLGDVLANVPRSIGEEYPERKKALLDLIPPGGNWRSLPEELAKAYMKSSWDSGGGRTGILRRMSMDEPSLAILTSPQQKQTERCHPEETRPFTVRESARIQSFPDDWQFCGSMASQYRQIGNAVPVNLAYDVGQEMYEALVRLEAHKIFSN